MWNDACLQKRERKGEKMTTYQNLTSLSQWNSEELAVREDIDAAADELFPLFCTEMDKLLDSFDTAAKAGDFGAAAKLCHRLKGSAAIYGFRKFAAAVGSAENEILRGETTATTLLPGLLAASRRIKARDSRTASMSAQPGGGP